MKSLARGSVVVSPQHNKPAIIRAHAFGRKITKSIMCLCLRKKVLLVAGHNQTVIGRPLVPNATVTAEVQEHCLCKDTIVFKFKRRKGYKR